MRFFCVALSLVLFTAGSALAQPVRAPSRPPTRTPIIPNCRPEYPDACANGQQCMRTTASDGTNRFQCIDVTSRTTVRYEEVIETTTSSTGDPRVKPNQIDVEKNLFDYVNVWARESGLATWHSASNERYQKFVTVIENGSVTARFTEALWNDTRACNRGANKVHIPVEQVLLGDLYNPPVTPADVNSTMLDAMKTAVCTQFIEAMSFPNTRYMGFMQSGRNPEPAPPMNNITIDVILATKARLRSDYRCAQLSDNLNGTQGVTQCSGGRMITSHQLEWHECETPAPEYIKTTGKIMVRSDAGPCPILAVTVPAEKKMCRAKKNKSRSAKKSCQALRKNASTPHV